MNWNVYDLKKFLVFFLLRQVLNNNFTIRKYNYTDNKVKNNLFDEYLIGVIICWEQEVRLFQKATFYMTTWLLKILQASCILLLCAANGFMHALKQEKIPRSLSYKTSAFVNVKVVPRPEYVTR